MTKFKTGDKVTLARLIHPDTEDMLGKMFTISGELTHGGYAALERDSLGNQYVFIDSQIELKKPSFKFTMDGELYTAYHPHNGTDFVAVTWEGNTLEGAIYTSREVDSYITKGSWKVVPTETVSEAVLPNHFKLRVVNGGIYTMTKNSDGEFICHAFPKTYADTGSMPWDESGININLKSGAWEILEEEPEQGLPDISNMTVNLCLQINGEPANEYIESLQGNLQALSEEASEICVSTSKSFLDEIKAFTDEYPASVFIDSGKYVVYHDADEYYASTDDELDDIMNSVKCLEKAANG